ncbi:hypothetical protein [Cellulomonas composti]|uniref:hypothetical protein n=1 Tax=Cellulomonas composti TaxID=266130 RepID=UPI0011BE200F|nr:hypothetical protein [Cellulomonas composti]
MTSGGLVAEMSAACRERLASAGFQARAGGVFTRAVDGEVLGWLGLNRAVGGGGGLVEVNPVVGVRHQALEALIAELLGAKPHRYVPATLSSSLGYLMPASRYRPWMFGAEAPVGVVADELVAAVVEYGMPYVQRHGSLTAIVEAMARGEGVREFVAVRLPVGYLLLGEAQRALGALEASESAIAHRQDLAAQRFRGFAAAFRRRLNVSRGD